MSTGARLATARRVTGGARRAEPGVGQLPSRPPPTPLGQLPSAPRATAMTGGSVRPRRGNHDPRESSRARSTPHRWRPPQPWHVGPGRRAPLRGGVPTGPTANERVSPKSGTGRLANFGAAEAAAAPGPGLVGSCHCAVQKKKFSGLFSSVQRTPNPRPKGRGACLASAVTREAGGFRPELDRRFIFRGRKDVPRARAHQRYCNEESKGCERVNDFIPRFHASRSRAVEPQE